MGACRGCGATLSPAQPYCHACGASVRRRVEITLEPAATTHHSGEPARLEAPPATHTTATNRRWPHGWPVATGVTLAVALVALGLTLLGGSRDDSTSESAPATAPPGTTTPVTAPPVTTAPAATTAPPATTPSAPAVTGAAPPSGTPGAVAPPLGEPLPYVVVAVDNTGMARLFDLTSGAVDARSLAVGEILGQPITDVIGGPVGPVVLRASLSQYHLTDLDAPEPIAIDEGRISALDEESGWVWFSACRTPPCDTTPVVVGFGPGAMQGRAVALPSPTTRVVATGGRIFAEAAGSIVAIDAGTGVGTIVATGSLLDARGSTVVVRSCDPDLSCPVVLHDVDGATPPRTLPLRGDDIRLSPDGRKIVSGSTAPSLARSLTIVDVATGGAVDIGSDVLRFVSVPFRWTPDGRWLVGATGARALVLVRVEDGMVQRVQFPGLENAIAGLFVRLRAPGESP